MEKYLQAGQSPEGIAGRIKYHKKDLPNVSKDTIYRFLNSPYGKLIALRRKPKKRRKSKKVTKLKNRIFIDKRPKIIENRERVGDLEGDFIVSGRDGKGILLVVVCRKLRVSFLEVIHDVSIDEVHKSFLRIKKRFPEIKTLTLDNDILFKMHETLKILLDIPIYFCHPYHSWEKGSVENTNKHIRKHIPKCDSISLYNAEEIKIIETNLNNRFMKCLKYSTPNEVLIMLRKKQKNSVQML